MNNVSQEITEYKIPAYIEEILTHHYCRYFMKMSIVRERDTYKFIYRPGNLVRLDVKSLDLYQKLILLKFMAGLFEKAGSFLISPENYLLEPELIYTSGKMDDDSICLMYYPDVKRLGGARKLMLFAERIRNDSSREEREVFDQFRLNIESSDLNRAVLYLDKIILRMESRMLGAAS